MNLEKFLTKNSMSLACLAKKCAVSPSTIMRVRDGTVIPSRRTIAAIIEATEGQVSVSDLVKIGTSTAPQPSIQIEPKEPHHEQT